jgi:zeaxanthin epoxidase
VISVDNPLHICIAGAGVGGLALANGLGKDGRHVKVTVVEQTPQFKRFGGPIQLASNALQIIKEMDVELYDQVMEKFTFTGDKTNGIKDGIRTEWYSKFDLKTPAEQRGMPYSGVIDRPDLQDLYLQQVAKHGGDASDDGVEGGPKITLQQGNGLVSYEQLPNGQVSVLLDNGESITADVLIGADGIWSKVRAKLYGQKSARGEGSGAVYSGYTVYAGELAYVAPDHGQVGYKVYIGPSQYFVITDIGKGKYQWYAFLARPPNSSRITSATANETTTTTTTDATVSTTALQLQETFTKWSDEIHDILKATREDEIEQRDLYDRKPSLKPWYTGHVALLGDGIHAVRRSTEIRDGGLYHIRLDYFAYPKAC